MEHGQLQFVHLPGRIVYVAQSGPSTANGANYLEDITMCAHRWQLAYYSSTLGVFEGLTAVRGIFGA